MSFKGFYALVDGSIDDVKKGNQIMEIKIFWSETVQNQEKLKI